MQSPIIGILYYVQKKTRHVILRKGTVFEKTQLENLIILCCHKNKQLASCK